MTQQQTEILYNETCPVCRVEINAYRKAAERNKASLHFKTLDDAVAWGLTPEQAARRLHARQNGAILSGLPAFQALWAELPRWRWLARLTALPLIRPATAALYDHIAAPLLYAAHKRRRRG